jgi:hypothetical protein
VIHKLHYEEAIPVRRLAPDTPEEFELIIAQLLEKDPAKRIATAIAVANRLKAMEYGLSLETRVDTPSDRFSLTSDEEYQLAGEPDDQPTVVARTETRLVTPAERALELEMDSVEQHRKATVAMSSLGAPENVSPEAESVHSTHFTTFDEAARQRATSLSDPEEHAPWWLKIAPLLAAGALIMSGIWYFSRPLSGDVLYRRVMDVAREGESSDLVSIEDDIEEFLQRFPTDDRAEEVRALHEELDLYRLQRQYERRGRLHGGRDTLGPIERAYVEATQLAVANPQAAILKLQALLNVFSGEAPSHSDARCLKLAREQLEQLQATAEVESAAELAVIQQRLDAAEALSRDDPEPAAAIRRGIVELYADKPWAEPAVARARAALPK